jgi:hypothetical protein
MNANLIFVIALVTALSFSYAIIQLDAHLNATLTIRAHCEQINAYHTDGAFVWECWRGKSALTITVQEYEK